MAADTTTTTNPTDKGDATDNNGGKVEFTSEQQAALDKIIKERLSRAEAKWEEDAKAAATKAKAEAEQKALEEQGKFKELADQQAKQLAELQPRAARVEALETALYTAVQSQRDGLPQPILDLLDKMDVVDQLEWLATNRESLASEGLGVVEETPRRSASGKDKKQATDEERAAAARRLRSRGRYNL